MNPHFDFYVKDNVSFSLPCFILNLYHDTPANSAVYSLVSEKIFQNEKFEQDDEIDERFDEIDEVTDQSEYFLVEKSQ